MDGSHNNDNETLDIGVDDFGFYDANSTTGTDYLLLDKDDSNSTFLDVPSSLLDESDDKPKEESHSQKLNTLTHNTCCNFECDAKENLRSASAFVLTYYQISHVKGKSQKVCRDCFEIALRHNEHLGYVLEKHESLLTLNFPRRTERIVLQDSDEEKEDTPLKMSIIKKIEDNLLEVIDSTQKKFGLDFQIEEGKNILSNSLSILEGNYREVNTTFDLMLRNFDKSRDSFFDHFHHTDFKHLPPLTIMDIDTEMFTTSVSPMKCDSASSSSNEYLSELSKDDTTCKKITHSDEVNDAPPKSKVEVQEPVEVVKDVMAEPLTLLPPMGPLVRPHPQPGDRVYAMKYGHVGVWPFAKVVGVINSEKEGYTYRIKFENRKSNKIREMKGNQIAYTELCPVCIPVGTRVIAMFKDEWEKECYYSGVIAEPAKITNKSRYLVFFEDGYSQYVCHDKIKVVCESSANVWEDIHIESRDFIKSYLEKYPERRMIKLLPLQIVKTEWNGKWCIAKVKEVDCSLANMHFDADAHTEWIYRGSTRFSLLSTDKALAASSTNKRTLMKQRSLFTASLKKGNYPYVEFTSGLEDIKKENVQEVTAKENITSVRAVARKSTAKQIPDKTEAVVFKKEPLGQVEMIQLLSVIETRKFCPHQCSPSCIPRISYEKYKGYNPLIIPLVSGWQRCVARVNWTKKIIVYKSPCGRRIRNLEELHRYLHVTKSELSVGKFDFHSWVRCCAEFTISDVQILNNIQDLSHGKENVPIPFVNYVDHSIPDFVHYITERVPMYGVKLNIDSNFLSGCDCTDDCQDREKCACWRLTIEGATSLPSATEAPHIGYMYKRLYNMVTTGIYECNSHCKCSNTCLNRVVQFPLEIRLKIFKTKKRGFGICCLNDIPQGSFICTYVGLLLTEQRGSEGGKTYGDEYLADLDFIEVVEQLKEGYERDVMEQDNVTFSIPTEDTISNWKGAKKIEKKRSPCKTSSDDSSQESDGELHCRAPSSFSAVSDATNEMESTNKQLSLRKLFGAEECSYLMDTKSSGNIGRYLNHSCSPNIFVQNVFVDTHDLRFPWVAFFAMSDIQAGTELTWDYNYEVGSVPGKILYCYCDSSECRGRLL